MKIKSCLKYLVFIIIICITIMAGQRFLHDIKSIEMFTLRYGLINMVLLIVYGDIGCLLGLDYLLEQGKKQGKWKVNLPKLIVMGIPSLYFSLSLFLAYGIQNDFSNIFTYPIKILYNYSSTCMLIFEVVLGYVVITSFYKESE